MSSLMIGKYREYLTVLPKCHCLLSFIAVVTIYCAQASGQDCSNFAPIYRQAVVSLAVEKTNKGTGAVASASGTGFVISAEGHVLTAYHVIAGDAQTDDIVIYGALGSLHAPRLLMRVVAEDKSADVALLQFKDTARSYSAASLGDPWQVKAGSHLCSLSFSAPLKEDYHATAGILSSRESQDERAGIRNLWLTQMPSNFGESGAPVLDLATGRVVALKYGGKDPSKAQNVNYLIPLNLADALIRTHIGRAAGTGAPAPDALLTEAQKKARDYLQQATDYRKAKKYKQAEAYYDLAVKTDPKFLTAYLLTQCASFSSSTTQPSAMARCPALG